MPRTLCLVALCGRVHGEELLHVGELGLELLQSWLVADFGPDCLYPPSLDGFAFKPFATYALDRVVGELGPVERLERLFRELLFLLLEASNKGGRAAESRWRWGARWRRGTWWRRWGRWATKIASWWWRRWRRWWATKVASRRRRRWRRRRTAAFGCAVKSEGGCRHARRGSHCQGSFFEGLFFFFSFFFRNRIISARHRHTCSERRSRIDLASPEFSKRSLSNACNFATSRSSELALTFASFATFSDSAVSFLAFSVCCPERQVSSFLNVLLQYQLRHWPLSLPPR